MGSAPFTGKQTERYGARYVRRSASRSVSCGVRSVGVTCDVGCSARPGIGRGLRCGVGATGFMNPERPESRASTPGKDTDLGRNVAMRNSVRQADFACLLSPHHKSLSTKLLAVSSCQTFVEGAGLDGRRTLGLVPSPASVASAVWLRQLVQVWL